MATSWDWLKLYDLIERILVAVGVIIPAIRVRHDDQPRRALSAIEHFRVAVYELNELAARDRAAVLTHASRGSASVASDIALTSTPVRTSRSPSKTFLRNSLLVLSWRWK